MFSLFSCLTILFQCLNDYAAVLFYPLTWNNKKANKELTEVAVSVEFPMDQFRYIKIQS